MVIVGHIAGLPVQESLAYVAPVMVVVGWIYWAGRRERRRAERSGETVQTGGDDLDELLGPEPLAAAPSTADPALAATSVDAGAPPD